MADRDDRWTDDRRSSDWARRRPGGERDFYRRDENEDDYGQGYGEEGLTNYRLRGPNVNPAGYGGQQRGYGGYDRESGGGGYSSRSGFGGHQRNDWQRGERDFSRGQGSSFGGRDFGRSSYGREEQGYGGWSQGDRGRSHGRDDDRGFLQRAGDEISSWFGDDDADRRRREDERADMRHQGRGPKGYRRSDDRIREDVSDRLTDDPFIDASEVDVKVENAEVTLTGSVDSRSARRRAEDLAERVSGVTHVQNNLRVASGAETTREERAAGVTEKSRGLLGSKS